MNSPRNRSGGAGGVLGRGEWLGAGSGWAPGVVGRREWVGELWPRSGRRVTTRMARSD